VFRRGHHEVIPLIAAFVETHTALRVADQVIFALLQLQGIDVEFGINVSGIKEEGMSRYGKQRLGILPDAVNIEILQVLAGKDHGAVLFADTLHKVADILDRCEVGKKQIKLIDACYRIALG
jgi:hypothetical protein